MSTIYFLSDAHLGAGPPDVEGPKETDLVAFLDHISAGDSLYLLGDIFDFWFDFGDSPPDRYGSVLDALRRATRRGVDLYFMGGNHDCWARTTREPGYLEREIGIELIDDPYPVTLQGRRLLLTHGDALTEPRGSYRIVRRVLRHPLAIRSFRLLPSRLGYWIAAHTSSTSRSRHHEEMLERYRAELTDSVETVLDGDWEAVIAGHVHHPERVELAGGVYLNLGDWITHRTFGRLRDGELTLQDYRP